MLNDEQISAFILTLYLYITDEHCNDASLYYSHFLREQTFQGSTANDPTNGLQDVGNSAISKNHRDQSLIRRYKK